MQVSYQLNSNELDIPFLNSIKELFANKDIEIIVNDEEEIDDKFAKILSSSYENSKIINNEQFLEALNEN